MLAQALTNVSYCFTSWLQKGRQHKSSTMGCRDTALCDVGRKMLVTPKNIHDIGSERQVKVKGTATGNPHVFQHLFDPHRDGLSFSEQETLRQNWTWVPSEKGNSFKIAHNALKSTRARACRAILGCLLGPANEFCCSSNWIKQIQGLLQEEREWQHQPSFTSVWQQGDTTSLWEQLRMSHVWYSWYNGPQETWLLPEGQHVDSWLWR